MHLRIGSGGQDCDGRNQNRSKSEHLPHLEVCKGLHVSERAPPLCPLRVGPRNANRRRLVFLRDRKESGHAEQSRGLCPCVIPSRPVLVALRGEVRWVGLLRAYAASFRATSNATIRDSA